MIEIGAAPPQQAWGGEMEAAHPAHNSPPAPYSPPAHHNVYYIQLSAMAWLSAQAGSASFGGRPPAAAMTPLQLQPPLMMTARTAATQTPVLVAPPQPQPQSLFPASLASMAAATAAAPPVDLETSAAVRRLPSPPTAAGSPSAAAAVVAAAVDDAQSPRPTQHPVLIMARLRMGGPTLRFDDVHLEEEAIAERMDDEEAEAEGAAAVDPPRQQESEDAIHPARRVRTR
jgi:hypothetical protein